MTKVIAFLCRTNFVTGWVSHRPSNLHHETPFYTRPVWVTIRAQMVVTEGKRVEYNSQTFHPQYSLKTIDDSPHHRPTPGSSTSETKNVLPWG